MLWEEVMTILLKTSIPILQRKKKRGKEGRKEGFVSCFQVSFVGDLSSYLPTLPQSTYSNIYGATNCLCEKATSVFAQNA